MLLSIGDLVTSEVFSGVGKILSMDEVMGDALVGFYESPPKPSERQKAFRINFLKTSALMDETTIFCLVHQHNKWQRARYVGGRLCGEHLVIYRQYDEDVRNL